MRYSTKMMEGIIQNLGYPRYNGFNPSWAIPLDLFADVHNYYWKDFLFRLYPDKFRIIYRPFIVHYILEEIPLPLPYEQFKEIEQVLEAIQNPRHIGRCRAEWFDNMREEFLLDNPFLQVERKIAWQALV